MNMKPIMTVRASWSVQASDCSGYGPVSDSKVEVEMDDTPTNILFARELIKMGMSILEKSSPHEHRKSYEQGVADERSRERYKHHDMGQ